MIYPCRCSNSKCRRRRTLPKRPDRYVAARHAACRFCGSPLHLDRYRASRRERYKADEVGRTCHCDGALWPHRRGSIRTCAHRLAYEEKALDALLEASLRGDPSPTYYEGDDAPF